MSDATSTDVELELQQSRRSQLSWVGTHVDRRAYALQKAYILGVSAAAASLARLRQALGTGPGDDPRVWAEVFKGLDHFGRDDDEPTAEEWATHIALTLFALHQQSQTATPMHRPGYSLGHAVRGLADAHGGIDDEGSKAVLRRFQVLGTSSSTAETTHHARGLIMQLRGEGIPLDYGLLADHFVKLQDPREAPRVRLVWGRDFYRTPVRQQSQESTETPDAQNPGEAS